MTDEPLALVSRLLQPAGNAAYRFYRGFRQLLRRVHWLRSTFYLGLALWDMLRDPWRTQAIADRDFVKQTDPWNYNKPEGQQRFHRVAAILDKARGEGRFRRGLEIACAEGAFTEFLASRTDSLLAVDLSPTALERARRRLPWGAQVRFAQWELGRHSLTERFDIIVVMDVLCYFTRPCTLRRVREQLAEALEPGGYLFVSDVRLNELYEIAWWARHLVRGGKRIAAFMAEHPAFQVLTSQVDETHVHVLLQKRT